MPPVPTLLTAARVHPLLLFVTATSALLAGLGLIVFLNGGLSWPMFDNLPQGALLSAALAFMLLNPAIFYLLLRTRNTERKLRRSEELFSIVLNGINDGVFEYDIIQGKIFYSPSYQKMLGYNENELGTQHDKFYSLIHPDDAPQSGEIFYQYAGRKIPTYRNEFRLKHKNGHYIWVLARGVGIWDDNGNFTRLIGTHTDITLQKLREEELQRLISENEQQQIELRNAKERAESANESKTRFLMTISHELRTPLNAIMGFAKFLREDKTISTRQLDIIEGLSANSKTLLGLVNDLLDFKKIESFDYVLEEQVFSPKELMAKLMGDYRTQLESKGLKFSFMDKTDGHNYISDADKIRQIISNLISNAIKFTKHGGIKISCSSIPDNNDKSGKEHLIFKITDTGIGISHEKTSQIFEKFVQIDSGLAREHSGAGIGLSFSKALAKALNGTLDVESELNVGSTFTLTIPAQRLATVSMLADKLALETITETQATSDTILLVEDYPANVMVAQMMLENLGYKVDVASSGFDALEIIKSGPAAYHAILMDVQMPHMDGLETTKLIRQLELQYGRRNWIIGVTAHAMTGDRERCLDIGMDDYISKPINPDVLASKLLNLNDSQRVLA